MICYKYYGTYNKFNNKFFFPDSAGSCFRGYSSWVTFVSFDFWYPLPTDFFDCRPLSLCTVTFYEYSTVLQALVLTCAVFAALTCYTFQSKRDFSKLGAGWVWHNVNISLLLSWLLPLWLTDVFCYVLMFSLFACLWILLIAGFMRVSLSFLYKYNIWMQK